MKRKRSLAVEWLERREVLSGNVTVSVQNGDLVVSGDSADNYIAIWQNGVNWIVAGCRLSNGSPTDTQINGQIQPQSFSSVTGGLEIQVFGGNDLVCITGAGCNASSSIDLGNGDDHLFISRSADHALGQSDPNAGTPAIGDSPIVFNGDLTLDGGDGNDLFTIDAQVTLHGNFDFRGGNGNDWIWMLPGFPYQHLHVEGDFDASLGAGDDQWDLIFLDVDGNLTIDDEFSGSAETSQNDTHLRIHNTTAGGDIRVTGGPGSTRADLEFATAQHIDVSLGDDADSVKAFHVTAQTLDIDTGAGNDSGNVIVDLDPIQRRVLLDTVNVSTAINISTGDGNDTVYATQVTTPSLTVSTGTGSDGVVVFGVNATDVVFDTWSEPDVIGLYQIVAVNLMVLTGSGNEGNGFYGVVVGDSTITGTLRVDTGDGRDNVLLGSIMAANASVVTGAGSDGLIALFCQITTATFNTGDAIDVVGVYDSTFDDLTILLGSGIDDLWYGNLTTTQLASLHGETDGGRLHRRGANQVQGEVIGNLTVV